MSVEGMQLPKQQSLQRQTGPMFKNQGNAPVYPVQGGTLASLQTLNTT